MWGKQKKIIHEEPKVPPKPSKEDNKKTDFVSKDELFRRKLCFTSKESLVPNLRSLGKGQLHYIEVTPDVDNVVGDTSKSENEDKDTVALVHGATALLSGASKHQPFRVRGVANKW